MQPEVTTAPVAAEQQPYTYADLLADLLEQQALNPQVLNAPASYWGENAQGRITGLFVAQEDYVNPSGEGAEPVSHYRPKPGEPFNDFDHLTEEEMEAEKVLDAGSMMLEID